MSKVFGEVLRDLSFGPLANLSIGGEGSGVVDPAAEFRFVSLTNTALLDLHGKFQLYTREVMIRKLDGRTLYPLMTSHGDAYVDGSNPGNEPEKFIIDTVESPFQEDVLKIITAWGPPDPMFDPEEPVELPIDDEGCENSIYLPATDIIQIPFGEDGEVFSFTYQAKHPNIGIGDNNQPIYLPDNLYEALECYIAHKIFASMNGEEHTRRAADLLVRYEMICGKVTEKDLAQESTSTTHTKLEDRGFV